MRRILIVLAVLILAVGGAFAFPVVRDEAQWLLVELGGRQQAAVESYAAAWPNGAHARQADEALDGFAWSAAEQTNTPESYQAYLATRPQGGRAMDATQRIEDLAWEQAKAAGTYTSVQAYLDRFSDGRHAEEARSRQASLLADDSPYLGAMQTGTPEALNQFLADFPGHARDAEARAALKDAEPRDLWDLLQEAKIEVKVSGGGIEQVSMTARNKAPHNVSVRVPPGTFFEARNDYAQSMVATSETVFTLRADVEITISIEAACADAPLDVPSEEDGFIIRRSPAERELAKLAPALAKAGTYFEVRQAAVWIITDDYDYDLLGDLVSGGFGGFGGSRAINEPEVAAAMKIIQEAGLNLRNYSIWGDRRTILAGLQDGELKNWLSAQGR